MNERAKNRALSYEDNTGIWHTIRVSGDGNGYWHLGPRQLDKFRRRGASRERWGTPNGKNACVNIATGEVF